uniref:Uncharacterized protein n=1 Tax=Rhizophora mucronata TaxID=61149 RepID=A0A2P2NTY9_RHIMU
MFKDFQLLIGNIQENSSLCLCIWVCINLST